MSLSIKIPQISKQIYNHQALNVLESNYSAIGPQWTVHQMEWTNSIYSAFKDHDKYLIVIYLVKKTLDFYSRNFVKLTYDQFYSKDKVEIEEFNIIELSKNLNIKLSSGLNTDLNILLTKYNELQNKNSFTGIPEALIASLSKQVDKDWSFNLFIAKDNNPLSVDDLLGMLVLIKHGDTATYLIGLTETKGKELNVNYALLWHAILHAKELGCDWFDIGGLDETTPAGIAHFKKGLNSKMSKH